MPGSELVVTARCHGNNNENFWEGNTIASNPSASGFQNQFTGSNGNIHISWIGKLATDGGTLQHSTYVAEFSNDPSGIGAAHPNPLMDGWPNPNAGWPELNTTRLQKNTVKVTADGSVLVIGTGRRTMTTSNAHQKMPKPGNGSTSSWNYFVRQYNSDLSYPLYSSLVVGMWDTLNEQLGSNTELFNVFKMRKGIITVGQHNGINGQLPVVNIPSWGNAQYDSVSAIIGYFEAGEIFNPEDSPVDTQITTGYIEATALLPEIVISPNPTRGEITVRCNEPVDQIVVYNIWGEKILTTHKTVIKLQGHSLSLIHI